MRTVSININERCPLRCRHCSLGFSETNHGGATKWTAQDLTSVIGHVDPALYDMILLAGGEPSLDPDLIRVGVDAARRAGLLSSIVSAPIWAARPSAAERFLAKVEGLDFLILSYDHYHLEFLTHDHYLHAAAEALRRGIRVVFQIAYTDDGERQVLEETLAGLKAAGCFVHAMRTVMVGNAVQSARPRQAVDVREADDLDRIPRGCVLGNAFVDRKFAVHGCCWSTAAPASPFSIRTGGQTDVPAAFAVLEGKAVFQAIRTSGFIDALSDRGRREVAALVRGERFASECDLCLRCMRDETAHVWSDAVTLSDPARQGGG